MEKETKDLRNFLKNIPPGFKLFYIFWFIINIAILFANSGRHNNYKFNLLSMKYYSGDEFIIYIFTPILLFILSKKVTWQRFNKINFKSTLKKTIKWLARGIVLLLIFVILYFGGKIIIASFLYNKAIESLKNNNFDEAKEYFEETISFYDSHSQSNFQLGKIYEEIYKKNQNIADSLGLESYGDIKFVNVTDYYLKAIEGEPKNSQPYIYFIRFLQPYKSPYYYNKIIDACNKLIDMDSLVFDAYMHKGFTYHKDEEYQKALEYYHKALINSDSLRNEEILELKFKIGEVYNHLENYEKALQYMQEAQKEAIIKFGISSFTPHGEYTYGLILFNSGNHKEGLRRIKFAANNGIQEAKNWLKMKK